MSAGVALVTGASGQDGSYLVDRLLDDGYAVHGLVRPEDVSSALPEALVVHEVDLGDTAAVRDLVLDLAPDEIFNLGGISSVAHSWTDPELTARVSGLAALTMLEAARHVQERDGRQVRFLQASSAEIFGEPDVSPQDESTAIRPLNPYGAAKAFAHHCVEVHRQRDLFAVNCVLYNHESPRRPHTFVTRKITAAAARIARDGGGVLSLGNLDARRDWGWAPDYVDAMVRALHHETPDDYVVATGEARSVAEFVAAAFAHVGVTDWEAHVVIDPAFVRPTDASLLVGDAGRARQHLGWEPTVAFDELVGRMVETDVADLGVAS